MTRKEAMAFAISVGKPIRHNSFSKDEFVPYRTYFRCSRFNIKEWRRYERIN